MADSKKTIKLIAELRAMDHAKLATKIADLKKELVEQHRANHAGELPSPAVIGKTRKAIAQALTVQAEKPAVTHEVEKTTEEEKK